MPPSASTYWGPAISESQDAVFHFDVKTTSMRDANGDYLSSSNYTPLIFPDLAVATRYSEAKIAGHPALGCRIYDSQGRVVQSFCNSQLYDRHHGLPAAKRNVAIGPPACSPALAVSQWMPGLAGD